MTAGKVMILLACGLLLSIVVALSLGTVRYTPWELLAEAVRALGFEASSSLDEAHRCSSP